MTTPSHDNLQQAPGSGQARRTARRRGGRRVLAAGLGAVVLAAALTACANNAAPGPGSKKKPTATPSTKTKAPKGPFAPPRLEQAWKSAPVTGDLLRTKLLGSWRTDTALYVGRGTGITVLDPVTGKQLGTIEPPEPGMSPCGMSDGLSKDGLGALAWLKGDPDSPKATCDHITLIDTRKGNTARWTTTVSAELLGGKPLTDDTTRLGFTGDVLAVMTGNTVVGLRTDKSTAWTWKNPGVRTDTYVLNWDMAIGPDRIVVLLGTEHGATWTYEIATLDANGKQLSATPEPMPTPKDGSIDLVSAAPMTALVRPDSFDHTTPPELVTLTREGAVARRIKLATQAGPATIGQFNLLGRAEKYNVQLTDTTVYVAAGDSLSMEGAPTQVAAFDLATGAHRWTRPVGAAAQPRFVGADDDTVYVLGGKSISDMEFYAYSAKTGDRTKISTVKAPDSLFMLNSAIIDYASGSLATITTGSSPGPGVFMFRAPSS
ncbi:hypothetical protein OG730_41370 (plasmid) [Streptomyces sp. NBC_01298]|uniref:hypothetical protein n=1 Tax=Streptomyces sp. NBC_01298 TaxID=2903817 RepID=UPI002E0DED9F|nr:hypothetical protein OG730_42655 [Streptomyces sp. NBC_01298]WSK25920.1 hypothetical protein OG730_41370 [Streptomyces sp. NBC_01298]